MLQDTKESSKWMFGVWAQQSCLSQARPLPEGSCHSCPPTALRVPAVCPELNVLTGCWPPELHSAQGRASRAVPMAQSRCSPPLSRGHTGRAVPHGTPTAQGTGPRVGASLHTSEMPDLDLVRAGPAAATIGASSWAAPVPKHSSELLSHGLQDTLVQQNQSSC